MIWSKRSGWGIHCDVVNPKLFELQAAKEILAELYIEIWVVDSLIQEQIVDFRMRGGWSLSYTPLLEGRKKIRISGKGRRLI